MDLSSPLLTMVGIFFPVFSSPRLLVVLLGLACIKVRLNICLLKLVFDGGIAIKSIEH